MDIELVSGRFFSRDEEKTNEFVYCPVSSGDNQKYVGWYNPLFQYGSVETYVQLTGENEEDLLTVWAPVLTLPAQDELGLMRKLLEMNGEETLETRFGIMNNQIVVLSQRTVEDLSPGEISRAITLVATIADDNDEKLIETYGGNPLTK